MDAVPHPLPLPDDAPAPTRTGVSSGTPGLTRRDLRSQAPKRQKPLSAPVSRRSGLRARPALALLVAGVLAGTGAGAVWSSARAPQSVGTVSSAGTSGSAVARDGDRASRDDERESLDAGTQSTGTEGAAGGSAEAPGGTEGSGESSVASDTSSTVAAAGAPAGAGDGAGSVLSLNPLDTESLGDLSAARLQAAADAQAAAAAGPAADPAAVEPVAPLLPAGVDEVDYAAGVLSTEVPVAASGELLTVPGSSPAPGTGEVSTVRIQVEAGLDVDGTKVADLVLDTLNDPRSWGGDGTRTFARTDVADATFTVTLASPTTVDTLCAPLDTGGLWSCGVTDHAVLNYLRWVEGSPNYGDDMAAYRQYLINHEVGHVLGHRHEQCGATDSLAPVMVQQSGALIRCVPNGWPSP